MTRSARSQALWVVGQICKDGRSLSECLPQALEPLSEQDRSLCQALCYSFFRYQFFYQAQLTRFVSKPLKKKDQDIQWVLLLGLLQLSQFSMPAHAVIDEMVKLVPKPKAKWAKGLVNAVLRQASKQQLQAPDATISHPKWLVTKLKKAWPDHWRAILANNDLAAPMSLRVNQQKTTRNEYLICLQEEGVEAYATLLSESGVTLTKPVDVAQLPYFAQGWVSVQDEAAQLAAELLSPQVGERILDACAAPGGKTCHLLEMCPDAEMVALDISSARLEKVQQNLDRLGLQAQLACGDARERDWWDGQGFDKILLDAPCSATGVIRRHPDIKTLRQPEDVMQLAQVQFELLNHLWSMLKPGGVLLYATCSVLPDENEKVALRFLGHEPTAEHIPLAFDHEAGGVARPAGFQFFPQDNGHDGFYYCLLKKS